MARTSIKTGAPTPPSADPAPVGETQDMVIPFDLLQSVQERAHEAAERTSTLESMAPLDIKRRPFLVAMAGPREGELFALEAGTTLVLGRSEQCDVCIEDEGISRRHAAVMVREGRVMLEDLGSRNGTFVGNMRTERQELRPDDLVRLGGFSALRFCMLDAVEEDFQRRLASAATRDALTGAFNRRHLNERLAIECGFAKRHSRPLAFVLFDVDNFKRINDVHGHPFGDEVLRNVAGALTREGRREDEVFRYGGEEFALLARETGADGAVLLANRRLDFIRSVRLIAPGGGWLEVRASAGVAVLGEGMDAAALISRADEALYAAKRAGKDRVVVAPPVRPV